MKVYQILFILWAIVFAFWAVRQVARYNREKDKKAD
jgi:hypothetical protein